MKTYCERFNLTFRRSLLIKKLFPEKKNNIIVKPTDYLLQLKSKIHQFKLYFKNIFIIISSDVPLIVILGIILKFNRNDK